MWAVALLVADESLNRPSDPLSRPELLYGIAGLVFALLAGAIAISAADRWRKRTAVPAHDETDILTTYRDMYEHGELTEAEYAELRRKVAEKVKQAPAPPKPPEPDPTGRPDPAKFALPAPGARSEPAAPVAPTEPPPPPGTS
ncbi:MAG TPA: hypothetical protein VGE74_31735 [Gemmata sp.]